MVSDTDVEGAVSGWADPTSAILFQTLPHDLRPLISLIHRGPPGARSGWIAAGGDFWNPHFMAKWSVGFCLVGIIKRDGHAQLVHRSMVFGSDDINGRYTPGVLRTVDVTLLHPGIDQVHADLRNMVP